MARTTATLRERPDGTTVVQLRGDLDLRAEDGLRSLLLDRISSRRPPCIIVDMTLVTFADSSGIGALIAAHNEAREQGVEFVVRGLAPVVETQLRLTGVYEILTGDPDQPPVATA